MVELNGRKGRQPLSGPTTLLPPQELPAACLAKIVGGREALMRLAYFVNQYPAVSHTFIRRELELLEAMGLQIERFALYAQEDSLVDPQDRRELGRVHFLLCRNPLVFLRDTLLTLLRSPLRFLRTLGLALRQGYGSKSGLLRHLIYLVEACTLQRWLRQLEVQHVHAHFGTNGAQVVMLSHLLGGPSYSFTVHGPEEFDDAPMIALKDKIRYAAFVVAISSFGRSQLYRLCEHSRWPRIHVVRCGIPQDYGRLSTDPDAPGHRLVCVGRLCEQKGQLLLIEAAHRLQQRGVDFELVLVGDGPMRGELESLIHQYGLDQHVHITGWCSGDEVRQQLLSARGACPAQFCRGSAGGVDGGLGHATAGHHDVHRRDSGAGRCRLRLADSGRLRGPLDRGVTGGFADAR